MNFAVPERWSPPKLTEIGDPVTASIYTLEWDDPFKKPSPANYTDGPVCPKALAAWVN